MSNPVSVDHGSKVESTKTHDTKSTGSSDGYCTRIWNAVKSVFVALIYYMTCCQIDLSRNKPLFKDDDSILCLDTLPENDADFNKLIIEQMTEALSNSEYINADNLNGEIEDLTDSRLVAEIRHLLVTAYENGLKPLEYEFVVKDTVRTIDVVVYAPEDFDTKKLPEFKASKKSHGDVVSASKWEQETKKSGKEEIKCQACTVTFDRSQVPFNRKEQKEEEIRLLEEQYTQEALEAWSEPIRAAISEATHLTLKDEFVEMFATMLYRFTKELGENFEIKKLTCVESTDGSGLIWILVHLPFDPTLDMSKEAFAIFNEETEAIGPTLKVYSEQTEPDGSFRILSVSHNEDPEQTYSWQFSFESTGFEDLPTDADDFVE